MSARVPRSTRFDVELMPHRLCKFCKTFVRQADCLSKKTEDLLLGGYDSETESYLVVSVCETYPSLEYIDKAGQEGCHLCSILATLIDEEKRKTELDTKRRKGARQSWIYTKVTLDPYYICCFPGIITSFCVLASCGARDSSPLFSLSPHLLLTPPHPRHPRHPRLTTPFTCSLH